MNNVEKLTDVRLLSLGQGETFHGEAILAVAKGMLQAGVAYVGGYPGAPVSHLLDAFAQARDSVLAPLGIHFEQSASEAGAAALLGASINYPLRGAATWKSVVGTNVAADALSNLASAGVVGGCLVVVGEDYGEGASVIQERTHAIALKSSLPLIDPRYHMPTIVHLTEQAFELSEVSHLPVLMSLRIRAAHMTGSFVCKDNRPPRYSAKNPLPGAGFDFGRIVLPPSIYAHEKAKFAERLPAARRFIAEHGLNEVFPGLLGPEGPERFGIILQGGTFGVVQRALFRLGLADALGKTDVPLLVLNVIHPLVPEEIEEFLRDKDSVLVVEEGSPPLIESQVRAIAHVAALPTRIRGKDVLPEAGEYVADVVRRGIAAYLAEGASDRVRNLARRLNRDIEDEVAAAVALAPRPTMPPRPPSFCAGCPERPIFSALKMIMRERGPIHVAADIGCSTFATLPPFNMGSTVLGYGLSLASGGAVGPALGQPVVAVMGDGGFWHNGLTTGAVNAQWNRYDAVLIVLENGYAAATGQQHVPSTGFTPWGQPSRVSIEQALKGIGVTWIRRVDSYHLDDTLRTLREALDARSKGLRVVISDNECMLAKKRRGNPHKAAALKAGRPVRKARFGVDQEVCVGDHACMRLNGCPSLTLKRSDDPLKDAPTAYVDPGCTACSLCGEVAQAARLCPSFYRAQGTVNPTPWQRLVTRLNARLLGYLGAT
jgi:indolepyruvate ferredoxin oxidoreductase alpha subunit